MLRRLREAPAGDMATAVKEVVDYARRKHPDLKISRSQLYAWDRKYTSPADLSRLVDHRGGNRRGADSPEAWEEFERLYCHANALSLESCGRDVGIKSKEEGWTWCGLRSCYAQRDARISREKQECNRRPALWRKTMQRTIAQDPDGWTANQCWVGDHKELDLWCRWSDRFIRPWLTAWMDWRTRRVCGWTLSDKPNSTTILATLRAGILAPEGFGRPDAVWIDNGKDYDCWLFHGQTKKERRSRIKPVVDERRLGVFAMAEIEPHFSLPFNPNGKSRLERWFGTLGEFCKKFDTYAGYGPDTKPEPLKDMLKQGRRVPDFETVRTRLAAHIVGHNLDSDHARSDLTDDDGRRLSPDQAMAAWAPAKRVPADPKALDLWLAHWHKPVSVGRNGITLSLWGQTFQYGQFSDVLEPYKAAGRADPPLLNVAYDPSDIRTVYVCDADWTSLGPIAMNEVGGLHGDDPISRDNVAELNRQKAEYAKSLKVVDQGAFATRLTKQERLAEIAAAARERAAKAATPTQPTLAGQGVPPPIQITRTPLDGQALDAAVGAESMTADNPRVRPIDKLRASQARSSAAPRSQTDESNQSLSWQSAKVRRTYGPG